jgi:PAS domain S-box-containing protein
MNKTIRCLLVEDSEDDALLVLRELRDGGYTVTHERVDTPEAMRAALDRQPWDIVIADHKMPRFSGLAALELLKARGKDMPLIVVSGTSGEEIAVKMMKAGAHDYLIKGRLARLVPAVERELRDADERRERKLAEEALKVEQSLLTNLLRTSPDHIYFKDRQSRFIRINDRMAQSFGLRSPEDAVGKSDFDFFTEEHARQAYEDEQQVMRTGKPIIGIEEKETWPDGRVTWVSTTKVPWRDADGIFTGLVGISRNITERKQAEAAQRESEQKCRSIFNNAVEGIFQTTPKGDLLTANPALARIFGYASSEELMSELKDVAQQSHVSATRREEFKRLMEKRGAVEGFEYEAYRKDGSRIWVSENVRVIRDAEGRVVCYEGTLQDITGRKQAADRIREQATLLDTTSDAIYVTALDGTIRSWNKGAERIYGWSSAEALDRTAAELLSIPGDETADPLTPALQKGAWSGERRKKTKRGTEVFVFARLALVRDAAGQPVSVFVIDTDITEKKQLDARFMQAQRLENLGALASGIAHDLNNVLAPILMAAGILRQKAQTDSERNMLTTMEACARRGSDIIHQVLTFARGVEGKRIPLQPRHLLREIAAIISETFPKNIELEMDVEKDLWPVLGDATQLHQVLMNLCVNARDAMPEGGRLGLNAENIDLDETFALMTPGAKSGPYVHLIISDTGTGIPPKLFDKIFDPFFTTKAPGKGTGLGLSTVLGIVRSHDGFIQFKSEVGKGTCFEVYLPAAHDVKPVAGPDPLSAPPRGQGELILVVDDEIAIRTVATKILEVFGYRVVSASDGAEALAVFMQNRAAIAAIVTDMLMPGMDGPTFVRVVRRIEPGIRIIGISGVGEGTTVDVVESLGLSALLLKPFTGASLAFEVHAVLQAPPGTKVSHSASPWRGVSAAPWGPGPGTARLTPQQSHSQPTDGGLPAQAPEASGLKEPKTP